MEKRAIKFRAQRLDDGSLINGGYLLSYGKTYIVDNSNGNYNMICDIKYYQTILYEVIPETVCQFTGLLDKNGKEIYEGDILLNEVRGFHGEVIWSEDSTGFWVDFKKRGASTFFRGMEKMLVAGNKFENPELLNS